MPPSQRTFHKKCVGSASWMRCCHFWMSSYKAFVPGLPSVFHSRRATAACEIQRAGSHTVLPGVRAWKLTRVRGVTVQNTTQTTTASCVMPDTSGTADSCSLPGSIPTSFFCNDSRISLRNSVRSCCLCLGRHFSPPAKEPRALPAFCGLHKMQAVCRKCQSPGNRLRGATLPAGVAAHRRPPLQASLPTPDAPL